MKEKGKDTIYHSLSKAIKEPAKEGNPMEPCVPEALENYLSKTCEAKQFTMDSCKGYDNCPCGENQEGEKVCRPAEIPKLAPCISVRWGDGPQDALETEDFEVMCVTVSNCYTNIEFSNVKIAMMFVSDENDHLPPFLPDGTPSVAVIPEGPVCFGDIPPCVRGKEATSVSRKFAFKSGNARPGKYKLWLYNVCFDVKMNFKQNACFNFELTRS